MINVTDLQPQDGRKFSKRCQKSKKYLQISTQNLKKMQNMCKFLLFVSKKFRGVSKNASVGGLQFFRGF